MSPAPTPTPAPDDDEPPPGGPTQPDAGFAASAGTSPDQPAEAGAAVTFTDDSELHGDSAGSYAWKFGDGSSGSGKSVQHTYPSPGRYTVTLTVTTAFNLSDEATAVVYVRGPGSKQSTLTAETGGDVPCPGPAETITVTVGVRVPSWADDPFTAGFTIPSGDCPGAAAATVPGSLRLVQGSDGNHLDAWGRPQNTLEFKFTLSNGGGTGTTNPGVTASWS